ncbi:MAG: sarcosine oxidase subunit gamma family protein [Amaricoccus sp.]|uniref:sarcosine oxidase subunit gamma n=1 Tax=Amaricoccus sp. TaxID=1872485 RepID=UPI0039E5FF1B
MSTATAPGVTVTLLPPTTRVSFRTADPAAAPMALPTVVGTRTAEGARTALCLGPDEWLIEAPEAEGASLLAALATTAAPHSAVDVSDREMTYAIDGPAALALLATGAPRDLAAMPTGSGARTIFDTAQIVLTREADTRFHLTVWRSFAPHVTELLDLATRELAAGL